MTKELTPKTANTFNKICKLKRDNISTGKSWMLMSGGNMITLTNQMSGESPTGQIELTKKEFERFIKFYETGK